MTLSIFALVGSYLMLGLVLLLLLIEGKWSFERKAFLIVTVSLFYMIHYNSLVASRGWPVSDQLPERFRLIAADVIEPNPFLGQEGIIYLWVADLDDLADNPVPRGYRLGYNDILHKNIDGAMQKTIKGSPQMGSTQSKQESLEGQTIRREAIRATPQISFHDIPAYVLPEK